MSTARRVKVDDFPELAAVLDPHWNARPSAGLSYADVLARGDADGTLGAWVVRVDRLIVSYGVGFVAQRLPSPFNPSGNFGYVQSMMTRPDMRRRGYANSVLTEMLAWMDERRAVVVQLVASTEGRPLYERHGFAPDAHGLPMVRMLPATQG